MKKENLQRKYVPACDDLEVPLEKKVIEVRKVNDWQVETDTGFVDIDSINKTVPYQIWEIRTKNDKLEGAPEHVIFRDNWEVRKNDADPATVRGDEPATATVDAVYGKARAKKILKPGNQPENSYGTDAAKRSVRSTMIGPRSCHEKMFRHGSAVLPAGGRNRLRQDGHPARRLRNFDVQCKARNRRHRKGLQESRRE